MSTRLFTHPRIYSGAGSGTHKLTAFAVDGSGRVCHPDGPDDSAAIETVALPGQTVVPGLIDTHAHLSSLGGGLQDLDVRDVDSAAAMLSAVREESSRRLPGAWLTGTGWSDGQWSEAALPSPEALDEASGGRPTVLFRRDRHAVLASKSALERAGLLVSRPDPSGGRILRGSGGAPTGVLIDAAIDLVTHHIPAPTLSERANEVAVKSTHLASRGVTCVHEAWVERELWEAICLAGTKGALGCRARVMLGSDVMDPPPAQPDQLSQERVRIIAIKGFADGALGSRGAQLSSPYSDAEDSGLALHSDEELYERAQLARRHRLQLAVHAIGDRAVTRVLDLFEKVDGEAASETGRSEAPFTVSARWRVEHAQIIRPEDLARLRGRCLATQPIHGLEDGPWVGSRLGRERSRWSYRANSLVQAGAIVGFGSDYPIESCDPWRGMPMLEDPVHPAVPGWARESEKLPRFAILDGYWSRAAYLSFDEARLGRIQPGFQADFVCLDRDPWSVGSLSEVGVVATYVGGERVF